LSFDIAGNVISETDPRGVETAYVYADPVSAYAFPTTVIHYPMIGQTTVQLVETYQYDYNLGNVTLATDFNNKSSSYAYSDPFDRITTASYPDGGQTSLVYTDTPGSFSVAESQAQSTALGDSVLTTVSYDGLGRKVESVLSEGTGNGIQTDFLYDYRGRVNQVSNPFRTAAASAYTTTVFDGLGRATAVTQPDGSTTQTFYANNQSLSVDPANVNRLNTYDAAGRLTLVQENATSFNGKTYGFSSQPTFSTTYTYNGLDELLKVTQGSETRSFVYDSLRRLRKALNPESGTIFYTCDASGNLQTKQDARGTIATTTWDGLNRIVTKTYSDNVTPSVQYTYGTAVSTALTLGRLTQVQTGGVTTRSIAQYDAMGRTLADSQTTAGNTYPFAYAYDLLGKLTAMTYPSGRTVNTWYDTAGSICIVGGLSCTAAKAYAGSTTYAQNGALEQETLRNGLVESTTFNNRFQPTALTATTGSQLLKLTFAYGGGTANNGNIVSETLLTAGGLNATQAFTYDAYNRLLVAVENPANPANPACPDSASAWCQAYAYDQFGNRAVTAYGPQVSFFLNPNWTPSSLTQFNGGNQWTRGAGDAYDAAGNLASLGSNSSPGTVASVFSYDGESRMTGANVANTGGVQYVYDGSGRRVEKIAGGTTTIYVYDALGLLAAEYSNVANPVAGTEYLTADPLGSTRLVTNAAGAVVKRYDYVPFGEEVSAGVGARATADGYGSGTYPNAPDVVSEKFTAKERDAESGLDYFGARYYGSGLGRFTSPDPLGGHYEDPQTLNKYAYVRNNPLTLTDPTGLDIWLKGCGKDSSTCQNNYAGTTDKDGNFTRTHLTGDQTKDATLGEHGISVTQDGKQYQGVWDTNKGENGTVTVAGEGALKGYNADVNGNCGGTCVASGEIRSADPKVSDITQALFGVLNAKDSGYVKNAGTDALNFFHPGATNFRGHTPGDPKGIPSTHIPIDPKATLPNNEWHVDGAFPYDGVHDWLEHAGCATHLACNPAK
jgi:RHS repeat-associated protein